MHTIRLFALLLSASAVGSAAIIRVTQAPANILAGQTLYFDVSVEPEAGEEINAYQFDVGFSTWLTPGTVAEQGYFAANGVFFFAGISAPGSITFISNSLAGGDFLLGGIEPLVRIDFQATQTGAPTLDLLNPLILLSDGSDAVISSIVFTDPVITGDGVPEPSAFVLTLSALAVCALRRLRGER